MCELLVRVVDKVNSDFYLNCQCTKRGDVIVVQEDGWKWGKEELSNPDWRIISMPGIPVSQVLGLLAPELPIDPKNPSRTLQRRAFKFDIDALEKGVKINAAAKTDLKDAARAKGVTALALVASDVSALTVAKPQIADQSVIGKHPATVIG